MTAPDEFEFKAVRLWVRPRVKVNAEGLTYGQPKAMTKTGTTQSIPKALITGVDVKTETAKIVPDMFFLLFKPAC